MNETIFLEELKELVALESFSRDAVGTGKVAAWIKKRLDAAAWRTKLISVGKEVGLSCVRNGAKARPMMCSY
mgnify:CR=1 FL=1